VVNSISAPWFEDGSVSTAKKWFSQANHAGIQPFKKTKPGGEL
jgi:hypothetical protein